MRSRPDLKLYLSPTAPHGGVRLRADAVLDSGSETPIDGVEFRLRGVERRHSSTTQVNDTLVVIYATAVHVDLFGRTPAKKLTPGKHTVSMTFDLPASAPPSYRSSLTLIEYTLEVRVDIPWWPDRCERYVVGVHGPPRSFRPSPRSYCSDARGAQGSSLYVEASLDSTIVPLGGVVAGAASLANVAQRRIRRVELSLVELEQGVGGGSTTEVARRTVVIHEGPPADSKPIPFRVRFPADATPSFRGALAALHWQVEIRAVVAFGSDETLTIPIEVVRPAEGAAAAPASSRVPPVGRERRALVWAEVARRRGLDNDPEQERMSSDLGSGASLDVTLEGKAEGGLVTVARVQFPRLGVGLSVAERRWTDALGRHLIGTRDPAFDERFAVRGREAAQVMAFLGDEARRALLSFDRVSVDDAGATLEANSAAQSAQELDGVVARAQEAARALQAAARRVPPPASMAPHAGAWRAFAGLTGGQLQVGGMAIHDAVFEHLSLEVATQWGDAGEPASTAVRLFSPRPHGRDGIEGDEAEQGGEGDGPAELNAAARALLAELTPRARSIEVSRRRIEATVGAPLGDPHDLLPLLGGLVRLARAVEGDQGRGPYRLKGGERGGTSATVFE